MSNDDASVALSSDEFESDDDDFESDDSNDGKKRKTPPKTKKPTNNSKPSTSSATKKQPAKASPAKQPAKKAKKSIVDDSEDEENSKLSKLSSTKPASLSSSSSSSSTSAASVSTSSSAMSKPVAISGDVSRGPDITTESEAKRVIMAYFKQQNRPYSAIQVYDNLHKRAPKTMVERVLTALCESGSGLLCKEYGKSKIYFVDQNVFPPEPDGDDIDDDIDHLQASLNVDNDREKQQRAMLMSLESEPVDDDFDRVISEAESRIKPKDERVAKIKEQNIDPNAMNALIKRHNMLRNLWKTRKDTCKDMIDNMSDGMGKKSKELMNDLDIETDEAAGVQLPGPLKEIKINPA